MLDVNVAGVFQVTKKLEFAKDMLISLEAAYIHHSGEQEFFGTFYGTFPEDFDSDGFADAAETTQEMQFVTNFYQANQMYNPWLSEDAET